MKEIVAEALQVTEDEIAFDQIMTDYGQAILQLAYSYVKNNAIAEDLTQEIFIKCYKSLHTFQHHSNFKTWLWRIAINHCKDYLRSWHHRKVLLTYESEVEPASDHDHVEQAVIQLNEDSKLIKAILQLPLKFREPIYLHYFEEMSIKEIELLTGVKQNTIKTRMRRAKTLLKESLEG
ncbi:sigma-70 family RNA polymerase sigma factor [Lederbergia lenta]|uniref:RNA polymerase ECF-type sigma factor n=1 Tax=Lederbergia lenta TaxID=1467 RepID=A0A2X4VUU2_LEDLE|nr:sigma-70 family RNA polymerase sigma factor [Lederbergia lenta]MCM3110971.1 sigma-70 family RNA polymerase sigma factor [Lederbergia lenta]MEC2325633.1 sigma-70 family RNA polymerase sigma factor [Lederbergia lenta]SQI54109.1 RNA polymerase ECF-type sigma factor [Lederbergia lenta]